MGTLSITDVCRRTGLSARALRFYEARGLVGAQRSAAGQRRYGAAEVARLHQVTVRAAGEHRRCACGLARGAGGADRRCDNRHRHILRPHQTRREDRDRADRRMAKGRRPLLYYRGSSALAREDGRPAERIRPGCLSGEVGRHRLADRCGLTARSGLECGAGVSHRMERAAQAIHHGRRRAYEDRGRRALRTDGRVVDRDNAGLHQGGVGLHQGGGGGAGLSARASTDEVARL
ncbi:MerR family transcriptional regulator [Polymorphobacter sp. PAMC 29334]|nr:MerR family transcriptional regulator [Polymorphobacter sp. PAMC 29334]